MEDADGGARATVAGLVGELSSLSTLLLTTDSVDEVVWEAAMLAVRGVDTVAGCGVTVLRDGTPVSIMQGTAPYGSLEQFQYAHGAGPVWQAMRERRTVTIGAREAAGWPAYAEEVARLGIRSSLVVPLIAGDDVLGALNLYSTDVDELDEVRVFGELVADLAATAMSCMGRHREQVTLSEDLRRALDSRAVIEQAKGVLITRGADADEAFATLRRVSQDRNIKLRDVATVLVDLESGRTTGTRPPGR